MRKSDYHTRFLSPAEFGIWDRFVATSLYGTLFHQTAWLRASGREFDILGCFDSAKELVGGIPAFHSHTLGFSFLHPPYFVPYSGPIVRCMTGKLFNQTSSYKKIVEPLARAVAAHFQFARINVHYASNDVQPFLWQRFQVCVHYTYLVNLEDLEATLAAIDVDRRNDIKKGQRDGLECAQSDDLDTFLSLLSRSLNTQRIHWPQQRVQEFRDCFMISRSLEKGALFFVRNHRGDILGGAWLVWDQHRSYYLLVGMDRDRAERSAVPTLIWHLMCFTREALGLKWFDFDGADVPQIEKFARAFGGHLTPFFEVVSVSPILAPLWKMRQLL